MLKSFLRLNRKISLQCQFKFPKYFAGDFYPDALMKCIDHAIVRDCPKVILEAGGVDRPLLKLSESYYFIGVDIDERPDCSSLYDRFIVQSIEERMPVGADMILSTTLLEHVPDNRAAVHSMFASLRPGGSTHHYVPSKWHPYSICLRLVGPTLQKNLIRILRPEEVGHSGYPTFFNYCTPSTMSTLFKEAGFVQVEIVPFFRATDYFSSFVPAFLFVATFENISKWLGLRVFASGFVISAVRPKVADPS